MASILEKMTLSDLSSPQPITVSEIDLPDDDAQRLKVLGICEGRKVSLIQVGSPMVVEVCGSQIGLSRRLANGVVVKPR